MRLKFRGRKFSRPCSDPRNLRNFSTLKILGYMVNCTCSVLTMTHFHFHCFSARVVRVERCVGPDGYAQRTSYAINRPGQPTRQLTRTLVIRAARDEREDDPNLPPTYDQAVTGKDRSVKVEDGKSGQSHGAANVPPGPPPGAPPTAPGPLPQFAPPPFSQVPRIQNNNSNSNTNTNTSGMGTGTFRSYLVNQTAPPGYSQAPPAPTAAPVISNSRDRSDSLDADDQTRLLM